MGVCQGQLGDVQQVVRVEGEAGDAERGGGQLEIDDGPAVLRRTQVNTEYSEHYTSLTLTAIPCRYLPDPCLSFTKGNWKYGDLF